MYGPELKPEQIMYNKDKDFIGKGTYGSVFKGRCRGIDIAVKVPLKQNLSIEALALFQAEIKTLSKNPHPNIVRFLGACTEPGKLQIVTERCAADLDSRLRKGVKFEVAMRYARDVAKGMVWLHEAKPPTIHRDLKPANILIDFHDQVKISDFGLAQLKTQVTMRDVPRGSYNWMAPEVILSRPYTEKIDVYSFGIILWQLLSGVEPYDHIIDEAEFKKAICVNHERPPLDPKWPTTLTTLMVKCWDPNPNERPAFDEVVFRLNEVLADATIKDGAAAFWWKTKFLLPGFQDLYEIVEWGSFQYALEEELHIAPEELEKLVPLIAQNKTVGGKMTMAVDMERFYQFVQWFGPFYDTEQLALEMIRLQSSPWFHGDISRDVANSRLSGRSASTFLVRLSSTSPSQFPFSVSFPKNNHERLERAPRTYDLIGPDGRPYKSVGDFVEKNRSEERMAVVCPKEVISRYRAWSVENEDLRAGSPAVVTSRVEGPNYASPLDINKN